MDSFVTSFSLTLFSGLTPIIIVILIISIRQVNEYQRGVKFMFGKFTGVKNPGWRIVFPIIQKMVRVDLRTKVVDVPDQEAITKDNISIRINAVIYYKISDDHRSRELLFCCFSACSNYYA